MKKKLTKLALTTFLMLPLIGLAAGYEQPPTGQVATQPEAIYAVITTIINWAFAILVIGAVIMILIAAYTFLTSAGDPDKTKAARNYILYALIAMVVGFLAKAIIVLVGRMLGVTVNFF